MTAIYKYPVQINGVQIVRLPRFSKPLSIQWQGAGLQLWALVKPDEPEQDYVLHCYGTGHEVAGLPANREFLGTVQLQSGSLVFHFFGFYALPITEQL